MSPYPLDIIIPVYNEGENINQVLSQFPDWQPSSPIIGAGIGQFIVEKCASRLNRPYVDYAAFCKHHPDAASYAPATALALLAAQQLS